MLFGCIYVPDFAVQAIVRAEPELRDKAVAVLAGTPPLQKIFALNDAARALGVELGISKLQAEAEPELVLRPRSLENEATARQLLLDCAYGFSPRVEDTAALPQYAHFIPGEVVTLDLVGLHHLFGPPAQIAAAIRERAAELGFHVNVGIAANPETAMHAARGFAGATVLASGEEAEHLAELPVSVLAPPLAMLATLDRWGIRTLRALAALPEVALSERLGQEGLRLRRLARGEGSRLLVPTEAALEFEETLEIEDAVELLDPLAFIFARLLEQLCARLAARALSTNELHLRLTLDASAQRAESGLDAADAPTLHERAIRLPVPLRNAKTFLKLLQLDLAAHPPGAPVVKVALRAVPAKPRSAQTGLFVPKSPEPERLELTLARIAGIVGEENVGRAELLDTHAPDAFAMRKFTIAESSEGHAFRRAVRPSKKRAASAAEVKPSSKDRNQLLALRAFRPSRPARVWVRDGVPIRAHFRGMRGVVLSITGPWRSSGDWWNGKKWTRDEWDVALKAAPRPLPASPSEETASEEIIALYRLARNVYTDQWFAAGSYD